MQPIYEFGDAPADEQSHLPTMTIAPANGFPPITYQPLLLPFTSDYQVMSLPPRALWPGETPPEKQLNWKQTLAVDLLQAIREADLREIIGIGHSFGGIATMLAAIKDPTRFKAIILLDPTILTRPLMWAVRWSSLIGKDFGNAMAQRAAKRRDHFESVEDAYDYFKGKRLFASWPEETLRLYAESVQPDPAGGVRLAWPRDWEAYYFRAFYTYTWREIPKFAATGIPVLTVRGGTSDTLTEKAAAQMQKMMPDMAYREVAGHGHLFPQSAPDATRDVIREWLATL